MDSATDRTFLAVEPVVLSYASRLVLSIANDNLPKSQFQRTRSKLELLAF